MPEPAITYIDRVCVIPDLDTELIGALDQIEELLLHIACWIEDDPDEAVPPPIGDGTALAALPRISRTIRPTQGTQQPRLLAPDAVTSTYRCDRRPSTPSTALP